MPLYLDYLPSLAKGLMLSLSVALLALFFSCLIGFLVALIKVSNNKPLIYIANTYTAVVRGVPDLVMMFLIFYGGQITINWIAIKLGWGYVDIDAFSAGVFTLSFIFGAFMAETFRASILAVDQHQIETAYAFGMRKHQVVKRILLPQMLLHALPGLSNNWMVLVKSTAILSVIGLQDIVFIATSATRSTHQPFIFYFIVSLAYLLITWVSLLVIRRVGKNYNIEHQT